MSKISELSDGGAIQSGDTLIAVRSGGNVKVTYGGTTTANIDGGTIDGTVIGGSSAAAGTFTSITGTSANINGTVTADGLVVGDNQWIYAGNGADLKIGHDGTDNIIRAQGSPLYIDANGTTFRGYSPYTKHMDIASNGDISFYEDTGTTAKFFWDASAESLGIGTTSPAGALQVYTATTNGQLFLTSPDTGQAQLSFGGTTDPDGGYIRYSDSSDWMAFATQTTERMRIDSSGNVGIGTSSPSAALDVVGEATVGNGTYGIKLSYSAGSTAGVIDTADSATNLSVRTGGTERARLDSSGNWLVGKTSADYTTAGVMVEGDGTVSSVKSGVTGVFNRLTSDGDIVQFRKDGTTVGSIGVNTDRPYFTRVEGGFSLSSSGHFIPATSDGSVSDNARDLGLSVARWKDLYLSGGVYLGGTGAANLLDDYEEGTFDAEFADAETGGNTASIVTIGGTYVKIGSLVTINIYMLNIDTTGLTSTNPIFIRNLPFVAAGGETGVWTGSMFSDRLTFTDMSAPYVFNGKSFFKIMDITSGGADSELLVSSVTSGSADLYFSISYRA